MKNNNDKPRRGRPASFSREQALQTALQLFWQQGYEGTSIADLVAAMGIAPPSLYAAFGSKEQLYLDVLDLYLQGPGNFVRVALQETHSARDFIERILQRAAEEFTAHQHPPGCIVATGLVTSASLHQRMAQRLRDLRNATSQAIADRLAQGQQAGELPPSCVCADLARFYAAVIQGMSIQARDGADQRALQAIATSALLAWPQ